MSEIRLQQMKSLRGEVLLRRVMCPSGVMCSAVRNVMYPSGVMCSAMRNVFLKFSPLGTGKTDRFML